MLYAIGCSYTEGYELQNPASESYAAQLGSMLGYEVLNEAQGGTGNQRINRISHRSIIKNKDKIKLAVIQWSGIQRHEMYNLDWPAGEWGTGYMPTMTNRFGKVNKEHKKKFAYREIRRQKLYRVYEDYYTKHFYKNEMEMATINNIVNTQMLLEALEIPYINLTLFNNLWELIDKFKDRAVRNIYEEHICKEIISNYNSINQDSKIWPLGKTGLYEYCVDNNYQISDDRHPLLDGHTAIAEMCYNHVKNM